MVNSNEQNRVVVSLTGVLSEGYIRNPGSGRQGRQLIVRAVGEVITRTA